MRLVYASMLTFAVLRVHVGSTIRLWCHQLNAAFSSVSYMVPTASTARADRYEIATIALHPLGDSYAAVAGEADGHICAIEMAMESHYKKDLKGHFIAQGLSGKYRNTGEHETSKEDVLRWLRTNLAQQFLDSNGVPPPVESQSLAAAAKTMKLDELLAVYDKSIYDMDVLLATTQTATVATERYDDEVLRRKEFESFGLGSSAVSGNYARMEDFSDAGQTDGVGYESDDDRALAGLEEGAEEHEDLSDDENGEDAEAARCARLERFASGSLHPGAEPEPVLSPEQAAAEKAAVEAASIEMELTYRYPSEEKRAAIRAKMSEMTAFEKNAAVARLRAKREADKQELMAQRAALGGFFAAHDVKGSSKHREKMMGMAMAATRPLKADKWSMICAKLGAVYGESPNQYFT